MLRILGSCAIFSACVVFALWLNERSEDDLCLEESRGICGASEMLKRQGGEAGILSPEVPPLVVQAEEFARLLVPPEPPEDKPVLSVQTVSPVLAAAPTHPPTLLAKFRLHGTSCYPSQPGRSMALISEVGTQEGSERWVKEGSQMGHFVIHEIRRDGIVYRDGDQLREIAVETAGSLGSIVQNTRPGSRKVSVAVGDVSRTLPVPAGPNNVGIGGN